MVYFVLETWKKQDDNKTAMVYFSPLLLPNETSAQWKQHDSNSLI